MKLKAGTGGDICTPRFIAAFFTVITGCAQPKCPSLDKQNVVDTYTYNGILFSLKKERNLIHAAVWMNHENITFSEISQSQKGNYSIDSPGVSYLE